MNSAEQLTCRRVRDCCVKLHSCVQKWAERNSRGFDVASKLINVMLQLRYSSESGLTNRSATPYLPPEVYLISEREELYLELKKNLSKLAHIVEQMGALAGNLAAVAELLRTQGCEFEDVLFQSLQPAYFGTYSMEVFMGYSEEVSFKEEILADLLVQKNPDTLAVYLSCWLHQPFLDPHLTVKLEAMLTEVGLRQ